MVMNVKSIEKLIKQLLSLITSLLLTVNYTQRDVYC